MQRKCFSVITVLQTCAWENERQNQNKQKKYWFSWQLEVTLLQINLCHLNPGKDLRIRSLVSSFQKLQSSTEKWAPSKLASGNPFLLVIRQVVTIINDNDNDNNISIQGSQQKFRETISKSPALQFLAWVRTESQLLELCSHQIMCYR